MTPGFPEEAAIFASDPAGLRPPGTPGECHRLRNVMSRGVGLPFPRGSVLRLGEAETSGPARSAARCNSTCRPQCEVGDLRGNPTWSHGWNDIPVARTTADRPSPREQLRRPTCGIASRDHRHRHLCAPTPARRRTSRGIPERAESQPTIESISRVRRGPTGEDVDHPAGCRPDDSAMAQLMGGRMDHALALCSAASIQLQ